MAVPVGEESPKDRIFPSSRATYPKSLMLDNRVLPWLMGPNPPADGVRWVEIHTQHQRVTYSIANFFIFS